jgi:hypothetical protein
LQRFERLLGARSSQMPAVLAVDAQFLRQAIGNHRRVASACDGGNARISQRWQHGFLGCAHH